MVSIDCSLVPTMEFICCSDMIAVDADTSSGFEAVRVALTMMASRLITFDSSSSLPETALLTTKRADASRRNTERKCDGVSMLLFLQNHAGQLTNERQRLILDSGPGESKE